MPANEEAAASTGDTYPSSEAVQQHTPDAPGTPDTPDTPELPAYVVGLGSSAGGLEALTTLLPCLPSHLGLSYVVVQHMSPTHRSMMVQLLARTTAMTVAEVVDGCKPLVDTIWVTPPNKNVVLGEDGLLHLMEPPGETVPKPSVNLFFTSLAEVLGDRAIGVVLSGTGNDGAAGLHAIKAAGGYAFAQEPGSAKYDGMVRAAIEAGGVDWIKPPESIGPELARLVQRQLRADGASEAAGAGSPATLKLLLQKLYAHTQIDFSGYKEATLLRRIERRMTSTGCLSLSQYVELTRRNNTELQMLSQDMLISVTSFFRDRVAFDRLRERVAELLRIKPAGEDIRVWVAGCATGEEAYSMAMLLQELQRDEKSPRRVQIFASDIDEAALVRARRAVYPAGLVGELHPSAVEQHFVRHADGYEVSKLLRSMVVFARHNLVQDPPFVRLDLVSCRNVLIYLQTPLQERLLRTFHYALNLGGLLFLGRSESVHTNEAHFLALDRHAHIFQRSGTAPRMPGVSSEREAKPRRERVAPQSLDDLVAAATAQRFAPACVLVDEAGDVRHLSGDLQEVMHLPEGRPVMQLMSLVRRELRPELARLIRDARSQPAPEVGRLRSTGERGLLLQAPAPGRWRSNRALSTRHAFRQSAQLVRDHAGAPLLLVCFERRPLDELQPTLHVEGEELGSAGTTALEEELTTTREHLYTLIEELETSNEETQSLNEELQTSNQELQSTNEELEAANEELQASNEELTTVNEELQVKSLEWQTVNTELEGIYSTVDFPLLAFNEDGLLARTNLAVKGQLGIDDTWLGRHVAALPWPVGMPSLGDIIAKVQFSGRSEVQQLQNMGARDWQLRVMPRSHADKRNAGVLLLLEENTQLRLSQQAAMRSHAQLQQLVERSTQLVCICDPSGRLQLANPVFERCHGLQPGSAGGLLALDVLPAGRAQAFRNAQIEAMRRSAPLDLEEELMVEGEPRSLLASYYPLLDDDGGVSGVCYQALDITRRKQAEAALLAANSAQLAAEGMARTKSSFLANMSHEIRTPMNAVLGLSRMTLQGDLPPAARDKVSKVYDAAQGLTRILDDVLDYSKIEAGALRFEHQPFQLRDVLTGVKNLFSASAQEKQLALLMDLPLGTQRQLIGDAYRLTQVLNNLVSNAIKFTTSGEVRINAAPAEEAFENAERCKLRFSVRDTGIGIGPQSRQALFQAFTQADTSVTRKFGGTGLGLAICHKLVELMQGRIGVHSELGQGSEFWFTAEFDRAPGSDAALACRSEPQTDIAETAQAASASQGAAGTAGAPRLRVLVAEDNALNQVVTRAVLEQLGHAVELVEDGAQALDAVVRQPAGHFDLVLMDLHMPVMDGLQATRQIRTLPNGKHLPILALTAAAHPEDRQACMAAGMDAHLSKPLQAETLVAALGRLPMRQPQPQQPDAPAPRTAEPPATYATPPTAGLPPFRTLDLQPLLERVQNNRRLVWSLLEAYVRSEAVTAAELEELMRSQRFEEARLRTHKLMGSATALGATLVAEHSAALNAAIRAGDPEAEDKLEHLTAALRASLAETQEALASRMG